MRRPQHLLLFAILATSLLSPSSVMAQTDPQVPAGTVDPAADAAVTPALLAPALRTSVAVNAFDATLRYSVNRAASAVASQKCTLARIGSPAKTIACDATPEPSSTATRTKYAIPLTIKKSGAYQFNVRIRLSGGTVLKALKRFTILPGPAVRFSVTGLFDQTIACDARLCSGDWVNDVARQIAKVTARDEHGNRATGYTGTVVFDGYATTVTESTLDKGVGFFAVKPSRLELNQFNDCATGVPADQDYKALTVTDKDQPTIRGCQMIFYDLFFVLDPLPIFSIPVITPEGCTTGCIIDPTETIVVNTDSHPIKVLEAETITLPTQSGTGSLTIVGETASGQGFTQELTLQNVAVPPTELPDAILDKCVGCSMSVLIAGELPAIIYSGDLPQVEADAGGGPLKVSGLELFFPGIDFKAVVSGQGTNSDASAPTCYKDYTTAVVNVTDGIRSCD